MAEDVVLKSGVALAASCIRALHISDQRAPINVLPAGGLMRSSTTSAHPTTAGTRTVGTVQFALDNDLKTAPIDVPMYQMYMVTSACAEC